MIQLLYALEKGSKHIQMRFDVQLTGTIYPTGHNLMKGDGLLNDVASLLGTSPRCLNARAVVSLESSRGDSTSTKGKFDFQRIPLS